MAEPREKTRPRARPRRRLVMWILRAAFLLLVLVGGLVGVGAWVVTRSWFIVDRVDPILEQLLGGEVTIGHVEFRGGGRLAFEDVVVRARGQVGLAGEVCRIESASVVLDLASLLAREVRVESIRVDDVLVRLSEQRHSAGVFNFMSLDPDWPTPDEMPAVLPPRVQINRAEMELGTHDGGAYERLGHRTLSGSMRPLVDEVGWYGLTLIEVDGQGQVVTGDGILVDGRWNVRTNEHSFRVAEVELNERAFAMCPKVARLWWEEMDLTGRVAKVSVHWTETTGFTVAFDVDDVGLTLPIDTSDLWARYRGGQLEELRSRARMQVRSGTIHLARHRIVLDDLEGELLSVDPEDAVVGVPYRVSVTIDEIPELEWEDTTRWMSDVLSTAPFEMSIRLDEFRVPRVETGDPIAVELPLAFARVLERFRFTDWVLSTKVDVTRGPPARDETGAVQPAPIRSEGQAFITDASGRYQNFPYRLEAVEAYLEFDNTQVIVHYLSGKGSANATMRLSGTITPARDAAIALVLTASDVPVDDRLREALSEPQRRVFDSLMHRPSYDKLMAAGWPIAPFELGGTVDLDLRIDRADGPKAPAHTTGRISVDRLGIMYEGFPYPVWIDGGSLEWRPDRVTIVSGAGVAEVPVRTAGGGAGWLRGHIDLPREDGRTTLRPDLELVVHDDPLNDLLFAAIPPGAEDDDGWPGAQLSRAARWCRESAAAGTLDYGARVRASADHAFDYEINVELRDGRASPAPAVAELVDGAWTPAPEGWHVEGCAGRLAVDREAIRIEHLSGHLVAGASRGAIEADGRIDLGGAAEDLTMNVRITGAATGADVLAMLPNLGSASARGRWMDLAPEGSFGAEMTFRRRDGATEPLEIRVQPEVVRATVGETPVTFTRGHGAVNVRAEAIRFDGLEILVDDGTDDGGGAIGILGTLPLSEPAPTPAPRLRLSWHDAELDSPLVAEGIRQLRSPADEARLRAYRPRGEFDAILEYTPGAAHDESPYEIRVRPHRVAFVKNDTPIELAFDGEGVIRVTPDVVDLLDLRARWTDGAVALSGTIDTAGAIDARIDVAAEGYATGPEIRAFLPPRARKVFDAIKLRELEPSVLRHGTLRVRGPAPGSSDAVAVELAGAVEVANASFRAGVEFTELGGPMDMRVARRADRAIVVDLEPEGWRAKLLGQQLRDVQARLYLSGDGRTFQIEGFRAEAREGAVSAEAHVGVGGDRDYAVSMHLVDVPLGDFLIRPPSAPEDADARGAAERRGGGLFARLHLAGERGDPASRVGRGVARVMGEGLASLPLGLRLLQPFHATIPLGEWDYANADFFVAGDRVIFEELLFESSLDGMFLQHLYGEGEMDLGTFELDTVFRSRGGVLLVRDLVGNLGDQLALIEVTGPLWDPSPRVVALPGLSLPDPTSSAPPLVRGEEDKP